MRRRLESSSPVKFTEQTVLAALSSYANDWAATLDFYSYASSPPHSFVHTPSTLSRAVDILGKHFEFDRAWSLIRSSPFPPHPSPFRSLFNRLSAAHLVSDALSAFTAASSPPFNLPVPSTYVLLIDSLCDHRHPLDAELLALRSPNPPSPPDTKIHNLILRGYLKARSFPNCRRLWLLMDSNAVPKDAHTYSIYMDALTKSGKPWKALKLYKDLLSRRPFPFDAVLHNTALLAAGLTHGADQAVRVLKDMRDNGCSPNVVSYNTVIRLLCGEGRVREAYVFLHRMRKEGCEPDVMTYHSFFRSCTRPNEILWLFERMVGSGCRPRMETYVMLMKKLGRWGFLRPVFMVWERMVEDGASPDAFAYNAMIDALLQKGMVEMARRYDEEMVEKGLAAKPRKELGTKYLGGTSGGDDDDDDNAFSGVF